MFQNDLLKTFTAAHIFNSRILYNIRPEIVIEIEKPTRLGDILGEMSQSLNTRFNRYLFEEGTHEPKSVFTITINNIKTKELDHLVHPGDVMAILPPVGGGTFC